MGKAESSPPSRHEAFNHVASGVQAIVVTVAVIVGGLWSLYTFASLGQREQARADLAKTQAEHAKTDAELAALRLRVWHDLSLRAEPLPTPEQPYLYRIVATVQNNGTRVARLDYAKPRPLTIYTVDFVEESAAAGAAAATSPTTAATEPSEPPDPTAHRTLQARVKERRKYPFISFDNEVSTYSFIEPQESYEFEFLAPLEGPGLYLIIFHAWVDAQAATDLKNEANVEKNLINVKHYLHVPPKGVTVTPSPNGGK